MTTMQIQLDPVALREATMQAIMGTLTPEVREKVLRQAITNVLTPSTDSWRRDKSPLQEAFDSAVRQIAFDCAKELVAKDAEIKAKTEALMADVARRVLNTDPDKLAERMADAFIASIRDR